MRWEKQDSEWLFGLVVSVIIALAGGANYHTQINNYFGNRGVEPESAFITTTTTAYLTTTQTSTSTTTRTVTSTTTYVPPPPAMIHLYGGVYARNFATPLWLTFASNGVQTKNVSVTSTGYTVDLPNLHYYNITLGYTPKTPGTSPCDVLPLFVGANEGTSFSMDIYC